jgi:IclR family mhp operon transcriptional activator
MRKKGVRRATSRVTESIRGLSRGLSVLRTMNRLGSSSILALSRNTGISRPALYRILATLETEGYVASIPDGGAFALTSKIRELSLGFRDQDAFTEAAAPILDRLQQEIMWPTDLAVYEDGVMVIRETTRRNSPLVFDRATVGWRLPVLHTSLGIAYLSGLDEAALKGVLRRLKKSKDPLDSIAHERGVVTRYLERARSQGYASRPGGFFPTTDSIAVCVHGHLSPVGAIGMTFVASAMTEKEAAKRFLPSLTSAARELTLKAETIEQ